jgi:hypothetical protein
VVDGWAAVGIDTSVYVPASTSPFRQAASDGKDHRDRFRRAQRRPGRPWGKRRMRGGGPVPAAAILRARRLEMAPVPVNVPATALPIVASHAGDTRTLLADLRLRVWDQLPASPRRARRGRPRRPDLVPCGDPPIGSSA